MQDGENAGPWPLFLEVNSKPAVNNYPRILHQCLSNAVEFGRNLLNMEHIYAVPEGVLAETTLIRSPVMPKLLLEIVPEQQH